MSVPAAALRARRNRALTLPSAGSLLGWGAVGLLILSAGLAAQDPTQLRLAIAVVAVIFLIGLSTRSPLLGLVGVLVWLMALGTTRRLVSEVAPIAHVDPLLVVAPTVLVLLALTALRQGALRRRTALTNGVLALSLLAILDAFNPVQGSILGGLAGLLFVLVPMLGFWIGRHYLDDQGMQRVLKLVAVLSVVAALYGLWQTLGSFPSWDQQWLNSVNYVSLNVNGVIRPFATFSSSAEYATCLGLGIIIWLALGRRVSRLLLATGALAVLLPAIVLASARGVVVAGLVSLGLVIGAWRGVSLTRSFALGALLLVALVVGLRHYGPTTFDSTTSGALLSHQVQGLADPLDPQASTAGLHLTMIENGLKQAFTHPAGQGVGAVTIANSTFGGSLVKGTEADPSNASVAMGLPGLIAYLVVAVAGLLRVYRLAAVRRDGVALAALGVVTLTGLQWLNGGMYMVAILPWLVLGWADRREQRDRAAGRGRAA
jgi:hypothetical protein